MRTDAAQGAINAQRVIRRPGNDWLNSCARARETSIVTVTTTITQTMVRSTTPLNASSWNRCLKLFQPAPPLISPKLLTFCIDVRIITTTGQTTTRPMSAVAGPIHTNGARTRAVRCRLLTLRRPVGPERCAGPAAGCATVASDIGALPTGCTSARHQAKSPGAGTLGPTSSRLTSSSRATRVFQEVASFRGDRLQRIEDRLRVTRQRSADRLLHRRVHSRPCRVARRVERRRGERGEERLEVGVRRESSCCARRHRKQIVKVVERLLVLVLQRKVEERLDLLLVLTVCLERPKPVTHAERCGESAVLARDGSDTVVDLALDLRQETGRAVHHANLACSKVSPRALRAIDRTGVRLGVSGLDEALQEAERVDVRLAVQRELAAGVDETATAAEFPQQCLGLRLFRAEWQPEGLGHARGLELVGVRLQVGPRRGRARDAGLGEQVLVVEKC